MNSILGGGGDDEQRPGGRTETEEPELYPYAGGRASRNGANSGDHEITLGTMTVLAIFFALAIVCAGFFGFGYSVGSRHVPPQSAQIAPSLSTISQNTSVPDCKPAPGSPLLAAKSTSAVPTTSQAGGSLPPPGTTAVVATTRPGAASPAREAESGEPAGHALGRNAVAPPVSDTVVSNGGPLTMVQVAALSHQSDAELVANTLKARGYAVSIHSSAQDSLLHVQVGPFTARKDAEAMRQRLLNDGFNAILK